MLCLQPWGSLMPPSQRGASKTFLTVSTSEYIISMKKGGGQTRGGTLNLYLQLAELVLKLPFDVAALYFMAELQEVLDAAGQVSCFQLCTTVEEGWGRLVCCRLQHKPGEGVQRWLGSIACSNAFALMALKPFQRPSGAAQVCRSSGRGRCNLHVPEEQHRAASSVMETLCQTRQCFQGS